MDPYRFICDNAYFAFKHGLPAGSPDAIQQVLIRKVTDMKLEAATTWSPDALPKTSTSIIYVVWKKRWRPARIRA